MELDTISEKIKNNWGKILVFIVSLFVIGLIVRSIIIGEKPYLTVEFDSTNTIQSFSQIHYMDTLSHIGLEYLGIDSIQVTILDMRPHVIQNILPGEEVDGFVVQNTPTWYLIYINPNLSRNQMIRILSHELIHVYQQQSGRLQILNKELFVFDGDTIDVNKVPYRQRPWEMDAYKRERELERYIRSIVF